MFSLVDPHIKPASALVIGSTMGSKMPGGQLLAGEDGTSSRCTLHCHLQNTSLAPGIPWQPANSLKLSHST